MNTPVFRLRHALRLSAALPLLLAVVAPTTQAQVAPTLLPYKLSVIAGGATASPAAGATCPVSGLKSTDAYGDGCQATEVLLSAPRFVTTDKTGVVYFSDTNNAIIRRIDPATNVISVVAGGAATNPATGAVCGTGVSVDSLGDGCPATSVKLGKPVGLAFSLAGDLYFADNSNDDVRKVNMTTGIITNVAGNVVLTGFPTFGYATNNTAPTGQIIAATQSYLNFPYGVAFDAAGNLYISDEGNQALSVVNIGTNAATIQGVSVAPGTIQKFTGYGSLAAKTAQSGDCPNFVSTSARGGCYFGNFTEGALANVSNLDDPFDIAVDRSGNVFSANYFNYNTIRVTSANVLTTYAGIQGKTATAVTRGPAGSFAVGNPFNVAADLAGNVYTNDIIAGVVYRVDVGTLAMYPVAGGASAVCAGATDAVGDGCPASQAIFGKRTGTSISTYLPGGAGGLYVDPYGDLLITDTTLNVVRMAASGAYFGAIGAGQPTQPVAVHFAAADGPASNPFSLATVGASNFSLGAFTCAAANSDGTTDCTIAVTATPSVLGTFSGTLIVKSAKGATANFTLTGTYVSSPQTRTVVTYTTGATCSSTIVSSTAPVTITATVASTGAPTGSVTFFANGTQIGLPQTVSAGKATLTYTFATPGNYALTAKYGGDASFTTSTSSSVAIISSAPTFTTGALTTQQSTVVAGQTALYSFTVSQSVYNGSISFACSGLPAYASCLFSPTTITNTGCTTSSTIALSILTQGVTTTNPAIMGITGPGSWQALGILPGALLALAVGIRRRKSPLRHGRIWLAIALLMVTTGFTACGKNAQVTAATPSGTSTVTVTATGSAGTISTFTIPLTVK